MIRCFFAIPATLALGTGLLLASVQPGWAADIVPASVSAATSQDIRQFAPDSGPTANTLAQDLCPAGMAGFGWG